MSSRSRFVERARLPLAECYDCCSAFGTLAETLDMDFYQREADAEIRVPFSLKWDIIREFQSDYEDTLFGDLSAIFRESASKHWGLMYAGIPLILDQKVDGHVSLFVSTESTSKRRKRHIPSLDDELEKVLR